MRKLFSPWVSAAQDCAWLNKHPVLEEFTKKTRATRRLVQQPADAITFIQEVMRLEAVGMPRNRAVWRSALEYSLVDPAEAERVARMVGFDYASLAQEMANSRRALRTLQREVYADADRRALLAATIESAEISKGGL